MSVLEEAISTYRAAANLLSTVSQLRTNLLDSAFEEKQKPVTLFEGHHSISSAFDICVPQGTRATLTLHHRRSEGATIESDLPQWMTLEGWLPQGTGAADTCFVELEMEADDPLVADAFVRVIDADNKSQDGAASEVQLNSDGLNVLRIDLSKAKGDKRKVVLHLRHPPASFLLREFALIPL